MSDPVNDSQGEWSRRTEALERFWSLLTGFCLEDWTDFYYSLTLLRIYFILLFKLRKL